MIGATPPPNIHTQPKQTPQPNPNNHPNNNLSPNSILYKDIYIELGLNPVYPFNKHPHIFLYTILQVYENVSFKSPSHDYDDSVQEKYLQIYSVREEESVLGHHFNFTDLKKKFRYIVEISRKQSRSHYRTSYCPPSPPPRMQCSGSVIDTMSKTFRYKDEIFFYGNIPLFVLLNCRERSFSVLNNQIWTALFRANFFAPVSDKPKSNYHNYCARKNFIFFKYFPISPSTKIFRGFHYYSISFTSYTRRPGSKVPHGNSTSLACSLSSRNSQNSLSYSLSSELLSLIPHSKSDLNGRYFGYQPFNNHQSEYRLPF